MLRKTAVSASIALALLVAAPATASAATAMSSPSPQKPCLGIGKLGMQSLIALINIGVQDVPILSSQQQQQCTDSSTINDGDDPLSHILDEIPIVSGNGSGNGGL